MSKNSGGDSDSDEAAQQEFQRILVEKAVRAGHQQHQSSNGLDASLAFSAGASCERYSRVTAMSHPGHSQVTARSHPGHVEYNRKWM